MTVKNLDALVVGAGFCGVAMGYHLLKAGISNFAILERAEGVGGVWRDNTYPGAACDIPAALYSYSFEAGHPWSSSYPPQKEILDYIEEVVRKYAVDRYILFGRTVRSMVYSEVDAYWTVTTSAGEKFYAKTVVPAIGIFNDPQVPQIAGLESFPGAIFHSACWNSSYGFDGKDVAVIGSGASAVQIVPRLAEVARRLTLFQRSAHYVMPKGAFSCEDVPLPSRRQAIFDKFEAMAAQKNDLSSSRLGRQDFLNYLASQVPDPALRAILTPQFELGCKRTLFSNEWYPSLQRENVRLVDSEISRIDGDTILAADSQHHADVIVFATGFKPSSFMAGLSIAGAGGTELQEAWCAGAEAYLGIAVPGFPNLFMTYGPNTNIAGSQLYILECQVRYIVQAIRYVLENQCSLDVKSDVKEAYCSSIRERLETSLMSRRYCTSYYTDRNGRITTNFPGTSTEYFKLTERLNPDEYMKVQPERHDRK